MQIILLQMRHQQNAQIETQEYADLFLNHITLGHCRKKEAAKSPSWKYTEVFNKANKKTEKLVV